MRRKPSKPIIAAALICIGVCLWLGIVLFERHVMIRSSNAMTQAEVSAIEARISGPISAVLVHEYEWVRAGQVLCVIDDRRYQAKLLEATMNFKAAGIHLEQAESDFARAQRLWRGRTIPRSDWDTARFNVRRFEAERQRALGALDRARSDLAHTRVVAPRDGQLAFRTAELGMHVMPGQPLFGFVDSGRRWVLAKVRETDLSDLRKRAESETVHIEVDAFPGRHYRGRVQTIGPSTEVPFAAIPPDLATGNFAKYVQWVPVRVSLPMEAAERARLVTGLSAAIRMSR